MSKWFRVNQDNESYINEDKTVNVFQVEDKWYIIDERGARYEIVCWFDGVPNIYRESAIFTTMGLNQDPTP